MTTARDNFEESMAQPIDRLRDSPRLFDSALLDKLSRVHWSTPLYVYLPIVALLAFWSLQAFSPVVVAISAAVGYLLWTLTEYLGHRYPFHYKHSSKFGARLHYLVHGVHHDHPNDPLRLVMPVLLSGPIMLIALFVARILFGLPYGYPVLMGFMIGYLGYDMVHYYTHHAQPTTRLGQTLRRLHLMHHFRDSTRGFGVSAPWWDYVFGTQHLRPARTPADRAEPPLG